MSALRERKHESERDTFSKAMRERGVESTRAIIRERTGARRVLEQNKETSAFWSRRGRAASVGTDTIVCGGFFFFFSNCLTPLLHICSFVRSQAMNFFADPATLELAVPYCAKAAQAVREGNCFEDPSSVLFNDLVNRNITRNIGIYAKLDDENMELDKFGSASCFVDRLNRYKQNERLTDDRFCIVVDLDNVDADVDCKLQKIYDELMIALVDPGNGLHPFQRALFYGIRQRGGERLGPKKEMFLQMIEIGLQQEYGA